MNPISPKDLFSENFVTDLDTIIKALETASATITQRMGEIKNAATQLNSTPIATNQAESTKKLADTVGVLNNEYKALLKEYGILANEISEVTTVQRDQNQILKLQQQYAEAANGSFNKISAEYRLLKIAANALNPNLKENANLLKLITQRLAEAHEEMNMWQQSTGKFSMQVGDYSKALNGLNLSTQQILREMPTLANSTSQFFMAISNNVPIFIDNFKRARQELGSFAAALRGTLTALFSWQTILLAILTILPKVAKNIHDKRKAQEESNKQMQEQINHEKQYHNALVSASQAEAQSVVKINLLVDALQDLNRAENERIEAANILKGIYKEQLENYSAEEIALGKAQAAIDNITASLKRQAQARALVGKLTDLYAKQVEAEDRTMATGTTRIKGGLPGGITTIASLSRYMRETDLSQKEAKRLIPGVTDEILEQVKAYDKARKELREYEKAIDAISKRIDVLALADPFEDKNSKGKKSAKEREETIGEIKDFTLRYYDSIIEGMEEGAEKALMVRWREGYRIRSEYMADMEKLKEQEIIAQKKKDDAVLAVIHRNMQIRKEAYINEIKNLPTVQEIEEEYTPKTSTDPLREVENALLAARTAANGYAQKIQSEIDEGKKIRAEELAEWQELIVKKIEAEKAFQLAKKELELKGKLDAGEITQEQYQRELALYEQQLEAIAMKAISKVGVAKGKRWNLWTFLFGKDVINTESGTISRILGEDVKYGLDQMMNAFKQSVKYIDEYIDAMARAAKQAEETANTEVDMARKVYEAELEARANGYANAVDTARMEYEQRLAMQKKAQKESEKIQKLQLAMESASQAASLLTATANIIAAYSSMPLIGQALAIAGIATMWTTFAAAKIRASEVTKYGEGMSEYLDYGGSHASGRDIDFGRAKDGRRRRVERGEVIGVINKRNVRKYGVSTVRGVIDSLNKGTFEYKYGNAFAPTLIEGGTKADLHRLENGVDALVRQGEYREMRDGDKRIIQYKNLTRVIR